ncbi:type II toxin-antitoxin system VapC family toxin [Mucilaginibacter sp.]|uniref:type II toxin-antitoxin system VapC family toxin n=1 Tax=Mucilaginibacter sp. TaxID=1882438 RepID=UPI00283D732C|nr:type II toxin-antitoxin system VapC family toxin [Mucilaginibacter sp.]MDR3694498.1 type II toxin-antitoxin system VapC family toxin [Mucilaginibacter sp.]
MAERFLIDTSAVIKYLNETLPIEGLSFIDKIVDNESIISFVTEIELQVWNPSNQNILSIYQIFISNSTVIGINDKIIQETIKIRKSSKIKLPDALIAATAIINNLTLMADNDKDFKKVPELKYLNPNSIIG